MRKKVYEGTEMEFDNLLNYFQKKSMFIEKIGSYQDHQGSGDITNNIYLIDDVAMEVVLSSGYSAMSLNDFALATLIGPEEKIDKIAKIIQNRS